MLYDRVLDEALLEHECLIDFIAVSPDARGKGVGALLMRWAEQTGAAILAETEADAVAANGVDMTLWVAADNAAAVRLYTKSGYVPVKRTDRGACNCLASRVLNFFLVRRWGKVAARWCLLLAGGSYTLPMKQLQHPTHRFLYCRATACGSRCASRCRRPATWWRRSQPRRACQWRWPAAQLPARRSLKMWR
jgi:hypothetical protein